METKDKVQNNRYSEEERQELILQWRQSGKSRKKFCEERSLNYYTFGTWHAKKAEMKNAATGFTEIKMQSGGLFAQMHLPGGIKIDFYHRVPVEYFQSFFQK